MLWTPLIEYAFEQSNVAISGMSGSQGKLITPGANDAKGSWADLLTGTVTRDSHMLELQLTKGQVAGQSRPILLDIGIDVAGGTSYTVMIPNLNGSNAQNVGLQNWETGGYTYKFPIYIPAGSRIAARAQVGNGTAGAINVVATLYSAARPELHKTGTFVDTLGIDLTNSRGVLITAAAGSKGAYVSLGTIAKDAWWFQGSLSFDSAVMTGQSYLVDFAVGTAGTKRIIVNNQRFAVSGSSDENCSGEAKPAYCRLTAGVEVWARCMVDTAKDTTFVTSAMAYLLGG